MTSCLLWCIQSQCWQQCQKAVGRCHMQLIYLSYLIKNECEWKMDISLWIEGMKVPWTPQCVSGDPAMCSYSHRETIVKSLQYKLDRQDKWSTERQCWYNTNVTIRCESCTQPLTVSTKSRPQSPLKPTNELVRWVQTCMGREWERWKKVFQFQYQYQGEINNWCVESDIKILGNIFQ